MPINQRYLTACLNSNVIAFWLKLKGKMQGNNYQIDKNPLLELPLIFPNETLQNEISGMVSSMIENYQKITDYTPLLDIAKRENEFDREIKLEKELNKLKEEIEDFENGINQSFYDLFNLTVDEIKIIEETIN